MEDIGDYIYLIIVALAAIGSFLKNKNKKQVASSMPEAEEEEYEYEEMPEEGYTPTAEPIPVQRPEVVLDRNRSYTEIKKMSHDTVMSFENTADFSKLKAKKEASKTVTSISKLMPEISAEPENLYGITTVEEARAAFISSEIFNRKY